MTNDNSLSQQELDALAASLCNDAGQQRSIHPYDPSRHRVVRERLQALEGIHVHFARGFTTKLYQLLQRPVDITFCALDYPSYSDFAEELSEFASFNQLSLEPLKGDALVVLPAELIHTVVDILFGGAGTYGGSGQQTEFTATEQRILHRLLDCFIQTYRDAWKPIQELDIRHRCSVSRFKLINIVNTASDSLARATFRLTMGELNLEFHVALPYATVEPLRETLVPPREQNPAQRDTSWTRRMAGELRHSEVELVADFTEISSSIGDILALEVGHILPLELPRTVIARVDDVPIMECEYGRWRHHHALKVKRLIEHGPSDHPSSESLIKGAPSSFKEADDE